MHEVILVDSEDNELGTAEKYPPHMYPMKLHRAFSVFVLNAEGQLLIHRRGKDKRTWPDFWTNTCCSHPRPNEPVEIAAARRLKEELGFECDLKFLFKFEYQAKYNEEYGEYELDHVFLGHYDGDVKPDPSEVAEFKFVDLSYLEKDMKENPEKYTPWFKISFPRVLEHIRK